MSLRNRWPVSHRSRSRKRAISVESATTELTRLPGLEVAESKAEMKPEHWIETGPSKRLMLFAGRSHPALAQKIAEKLGIQVGDVSLRTFASGETYCRYEESIRGADLFIVQTSSPPVDQHLMELLIMIDAAKLASAKRITAVLPLYPYSRQDKKSRPREPITAKLVAEMVQSAGADRVLTMDLHAGQVQGFFEVPVDHMTALPMLAQYFRDLGLPEELVAVAPDTGRTRLASKFAEMMGTGDSPWRPKRTISSSSATARPTVSALRSMPGPLVAVTPIWPPNAAPSAMPAAAISSSAWIVEMAKPLWRDS